MKAVTKRKAVVGFLETGLGTVIVTIVGIIQLGLLARYLSKTELGIYALLQLVIVIFSLANPFGNNASIVHYQEKNPNTLNELLWLYFGFGGIIYAIIFISAPVIEAYYDYNNLSYMLRIYSVTILFNAISSHYITLFKKELEISFIARINVITKIIELVGIIFVCFVLKGSLLMPVLTILLISSVISCLIVFISGMKRFYIPFLPSQFFQKTKHHIRYNFDLVISSFVNKIGNNLDKIFISAFFGIEQFAVYELAYKLMQKPINLINPIFSDLSFPLLSKFKDDHAKVNQLFLFKIESISFVLIPLFFLMFILSEEIVYLYYGPEWEQTAKIFKYLWFLALARSLSGATGTYLLSMGKTKFILYLNIYKFIIIAIILGIVGRFFDFETTIIFFVLGMIIFTIPINYYFRKIITNMSVLSHFKSFSKAYLSSIIMIVILYLVKHKLLINSSNLSTFIVITIIAIVIYLILSLLINKPLLLKTMDLVKSRNQKNLDL